MLQKFKVLFVLLVLTSSQSWSQFLLRVDENSGLERSRNKSIVIDEDENIYIAGEFTSVCDFDNSEDSLNLSTIGNQDMFIQKLDPLGNLLWVKQFGATFKPQSVEQMTLDNEGNIVMFGEFNGDLDFDPSDDEYILSGISNDTYILKLTGDGDFVFAARLSEKTDPTKLEINGENDILLAGDFKTTVDFDPGDDLFELTSPDEISGFLLKLSENGEFMWANRFGEDSFYVEGMAIDQDNNIHLATLFYDDTYIDFEGGIIEFFSPGAIGTILLKLNNTDGEISNYQQIDDDQAIRPTDLAIDNAGNLILAGTFRNEADFDLSDEEVILTANEYGSPFLLKMTDNYEFIFANAYFSTSAESKITRIVLDQYDDIYVLMNAFGETDMDPTAGNAIISASGEDVCIAKYSEGGVFNWKFRIGFSGTDQGTDILVDAVGNVFVTGSFVSNCEFEPYPTVSNTYKLGAQGVEDGFMAKYYQGLVSLEEEAENEQSITAYPNPANEQLTISFTETQQNTEVLIFNLRGELVLRTTVNDASNQMIDISGLSTGHYVVRVQSEHGVEQVSFVKV